MSGPSPRPSLPRWISVDLVLSERDMVRVESAVIASGVRFTHFVREAVRIYGAKNGIEFPPFEVRIAYSGQAAPGARRVTQGTASNPIRHPVTFPRSWHVPLNRTANALGLSKSAILRVATLQRVNGVL